MNKNMKITLLLLALGAGFELKAADGMNFEQPQPRTTSEDEQEQELQQKHERLAKKLQDYTYMRNEQARKYAYSREQDQKEGKPELTETKLPIERPGTFFDGKGLFSKSTLTSIATKMSDSFSNWFGDVGKVKDQLTNTSVLDADGQAAFNRLRTDQKEDILKEWLKLEKKKNSDEHSIHFNNIEKPQHKNLNSLTKKQNDQINKDIEQIKEIDNRLNDIDHESEDPIIIAEHTDLINRKNLLTQAIKQLKLSNKQAELKININNLNAHIAIQDRFNTRIDAFVNKMQELLDQDPENNLKIKYNADTQEFEFHDLVKEKKARTAQAQEIFNRNIIAARPIDFTEMPSSKQQEQDTETNVTALHEKFIQEGSAPQTIQTNPRDFTPIVVNDNSFITRGQPTLFEDDAERRNALKALEEQFGVSGDLKAATGKSLAEREQEAALRVASLLGDTTPQEISKSIATAVATAAIPEAERAVASKDLLAQLEREATLEIARNEEEAARNALTQEEKTKFEQEVTKLQQERQNLEKARADEEAKLQEEQQKLHFVPDVSLPTSAASTSFERPSSKRSIFESTDDEFEAAFEKMMRENQ
ncbi:MAG TPA: hypothetical protein VLG50_08775 [Candidatus Saccharimonadales bacterium]|nr:hypothetical protein [Candidatus Saccharimonadales bacterium]